MSENEKQMSKKELKEEMKKRKLELKNQKAKEKAAIKEEKERIRNSFGRKIRNFFLTIIFSVILVIGAFFGGKYYLAEKEKEINKNKSDDVYDSAVKYMDEEKYEKALEKLEKIDSDFEKYDEVEEMIKEAKLGILNQEIEELVDDDDYLGVLELLNEKYDDYKEYKSEIKKYKEKYKELFIEQVENDMDKDLEKAKKDVKSALNIMDDDKDLEDLLDKIDNQEPIDLSLMSTFQFGGSVITSADTKERARDNIGMFYSSFVGLANKTGDEKGKNFVVYKLGKDYNKMSGTICVDYASRASKTTGTVIKIYGDDELIYTSSELKSGVEPTSFSIDVSSVDKLKIEIEGEKDFSCFIGNPIVKK